MLNRLQGVFASLQKHEVKYVVLGGIAALKNISIPKLSPIK